MFKKGKKAKGWSASAAVELLETRVLYSADPLGAIADILSDGLVDDLYALDHSHSIDHEYFPRETADSVPSPSRDVAIRTDRLLSPASIDFSVDIFDQLAVESEYDDVTHIASPDELRTEIIFVDDGVADGDFLVRELSATDSGTSTHIYRLDSAENGIDQITSVLATFQQVDTVHIVSHGGAANIQLGNSVLSTETLSEYRDDLAQWRHAFSESGDVLLYGCDLASTAEGKALVDVLAVLTDADVAASEDITGHETLHGDWDLEYHSGHIESEVPVVDYLAKNWVGSLATVTVTTFNDSNDGGDTTSVASLQATPGTDGISLREAIIATNNDAGQADTIVLSEGTYTLSIAGRSENESATGDLDILDDLTIVGAGADKTIIDGDNTHRIFHIIGDTAINVSISDVKIQNGFSVNFIENVGPGLHIATSPSKPIVTVDGVWFSGNNTTANGLSSGGAIFNQGDLTIQNSLIEGNSAEAGGGVINYFGATINMTNVTFANNVATGGDGGGFYNAEEAVLQSVTLAGNSANDEGGGIYSSGFGGTTTEIRNSLIANNLAATNADIHGDYVSTTGNNLIETVGSATGLNAGDITGVDPNLGTLTDNGGTTPTFALNAGSAAIGSGSSVGAPVVDQRGVARDVSPDIGAFEYESQGGILLSTKDNVVSPSGAPGLDAWRTDEIITIDNPDFTLDPVTTNGTFSSVLQFQDFTGDGDLNVDALHYVTKDMIVAGFNFHVGDIIFSTKDDETLQGTFFDKDDVLVFQPTVAGDYSAGSFTLLIDQSEVGGSVTNQIQGVTLVEQDTVVGDVTLQTGDFLLLMKGGAHDDHIYRFQPTGLGVATSGTATGKFIDGDQIGITDNLSGIELIEADTTIGDEALSAGQIVLSVENSGDVGTNSTAVAEEDLWVLDVTATTEGSGTAAATTQLLFDGSDLGFNAGQNWNAVSFTAGLPVINTEPVLTSVGANPVFTEGGGEVDLFGSTVVSTVESSQTVSGVTLTVGSVLDGAAEMLTLDGSTITLTDGNSGVSAINTLTYSVTVASGVATVTLGGGSLSEADAQSLVDTLRYQNSSEDPSSGNRIVTLTEIVDSGGTANGGDDTTTLSVSSSISVIDVNDEPVLTSTASDPLFAEGDVPVSVFNSTVMNTVETGQTVNSLTLTVDNVSDGIDELLTLDGSVITLTNGNSGTSATNALTYNVSVAAGTATVTLSAGSLSEIEVQALVDALQYQNTSEDPTSGNRIVTLTEIVDSGGTANTGDDTALLSVSSSIGLQVVNDESTLTSTATDPVFNEGDFSVSVFSGTSVSTIEAGQTVSGVTLTVDNVSDGVDEILTLDGSLITLTNGNSGTGITNALTYNVTVTAGTATVILSAGTLTEVETQSLIDTLRYQNISNDPAAGNRVVTLVEIVDSGGTANGGDDSAALAVSSTIGVQVVNDAPTLTSTAVDPLFSEGDVPVNVFSGTSVSTIEAGQTVSGLTLTVGNVSDGADELLTVDGSVITLTNGSSGVSDTNTLTYNVSVVAGTASVSLSGGSLTEAQTQSLVDALRYQNTSDDPTAGNRVVTLIEIVDSGGSVNGGDDTAALAVSSTIGVQVVNDAPTLTSTAVDPLFSEGDGPVSVFNSTVVNTVETGQAVSGLTLTVDSVSDGIDELLTVDGSVITLTNGNSGTSATNALTYNVSVAAGTATVTLSAGSLSEIEVQALVDALQYQNTSENPTSGNRIVTLTEIVDSGGTANGGDDSAALAVISTIGVQVVNDAPTLTSTAGDPLFSEGDVPVNVFSGTSVSTIEAGQTLSGLTLTVGNLSDGVDELLTVDGSAITLTNGNSGTSTTNALTYNVSVVAGTATVTLSGGSLTEAQTQSLVDALQYQNTSDDPTSGNRVVTLTEVVDSGGTANGGDETAVLAISSLINVQSVNDSPTLTSTAGDPLFSEGDVPVNVFSGTSVSTIEAGQTVSGLTLTVGNLSDGADELLTVDGSVITLTNGNSGTSTTNALTYNVSVVAGTATVTLSGGSLTEAQTRSLVDALQYQNTSESPTSGNRIVTLTEIVDSGGTANAGDDSAALAVSSTIGVQVVNDAPTLTSTAGDPVFTEGDVPVNVFSGTSVSTIEAGQTVSGLTLTVGNVSDGADELLTVDGSVITLTNGNSGTSATNALTYNVSVVAGAATVTLSGGSLSDAETQSLVDALQFQNTGDDPTAGNRVVTLIEIVDSGGSANGGDDSAALAVSSTIGVQVVNDSPTLTSTAGDPVFTEGDVQVNVFSGTSVSTIESGQTLSGLTLTVGNVSDGVDELLTVDGSVVTLTNGNSGVSATNTLTYNVSVVAGTASVSLSGGSLTEAQTQSLVDALQYQNTSEEPTSGNRLVTLTEVVDSGGNANGGDETAVLAISSLINVQSVNDSPTLTSTAGDPVFTEANGPVSLFSGTSVSTIEAGQTVSGLTLTVGNVSDGADELLTVDGSVITLTNGTSGVSATNTLIYNVSVVAGTATVSLSGGSLTEAQTQSLVDTLQYQNTSEEPTSGNRLVTLTEVVDSGGNANGGDDTAVLAISSLINVQPVNDEPTLTSTAGDPLFSEGDVSINVFSGTSVSTIEAGQTVSGLTLTVGNVSDGADELLTVDGSVITLTNGSNGVSDINTLTYNVSVVAGTATVSLSGGSLTEAQTQSLVDALRYQNSSDDPTAGNRVVTLIEIVDSGGSANGGDDTAALAVSSTIGVQVVNDAPTLTSTAVDPLFSEGDGPVSVFNSTVVNTVETGQAVSGLTLTVDSVSDGIDELLTVDGSVITLTNGNSGTSTTNALTYNVSVVAGTATVTLSGGSLTEAQTRSLVDALQYQNTSEEPTAGNRVVTLTEVVDSGGTANGGDDTAVLAISSVINVQPVNDAPTLTSTAGDPLFSEGDVPVNVFSGTSVSTIESSQTLSGLTLTVGNVSDGADELLTVDGSVITLTNGTSGVSATNTLTYNVSVVAETATVTLSGGSLSEAQIQNLVDALQYQNTSSDPASGNRLVSLIEIVDSGGTVNGGNDTAALSISSLIAVQVINDEPTLTSTASNPLFAEGDGPVSVFNSTSVSTVEPGQTVSGLTLTISIAGDDVAESLTLDGSVITLINGTSGVSATNALAYNVTVVADTATVSLSGGSLSEAETQSLVDALRYQNTSENPTSGIRSVTLTEIVDSGGVTNGGDDTAALSVSSLIDVQAVNDGPILTSTASNPLFTEGDASVSVFSNTSVSTVEPGQTISGLTLTVSNTSDGVAELLTLDGSVVALVNGNSGSSITNALAYNVSVIAGTATVNLSGGSLTEVEVQRLTDGLLYQNSGNDPTPGNRQVTLSEIVDSGGSLNGGMDTSVLNVTSDISVNAINSEQLLVLSRGDRVFEGESVVITNTNLLTSDVESTPTSLVYTLSVVPEHGWLIANGQTLSENDTFTQNEINNNQLIYQHDGSESTATHFDFAVDDGVGIASTGTFLLTIESVNDNDPVAGADRLVVAEGGIATETNISNGESLLSGDTDADLPNDVLSVGLVPVIEPKHGTLTLKSDGSFQYIHDGSENFVDQFSYELFDSNGGQSDVAIVTIVIEPVNDLPVVQKNELTIGPAEAVVMSRNELFATDSDGAAPNLVFVVSGLAGGHFELLSMPGSVVSSFTQAQIDAGLVQFVSDDVGEMPGYSVTVSDGEGIQMPSVAMITYIPSVTPTLEAAEPQPVIQSFVAPIIAPQNVEENLQESTVTTPVNNVQEKEPADDTNDIVSIPDFSGQVEPDRERTQIYQTSYRVDKVVEVVEESISSKSNQAESFSDQDANSIPVSLLSEFEMERLLESMNEVRNGSDRISNVYQDVVGSGAGITAGLTVGYVAWLIRGGVLLSSALSSLPAWQFIDPLPVLSYKRDKEEPDSLEDDSLESIVQSQKHSTMQRSGT